MNKTIALVPQPLHFTRESGFFTLTESTKIHVTPELLSEANLLAARLRLASGFPLPVGDGAVDSSEESSITLQLVSQSKVEHEEGYRLKVESKKILIEASTSAGIFYGTQTLLQLLPPAIFSHGVRYQMAWEIPCVTIEDHPRFSWRGAMLDCSRYFKPVGFIKKFIDILSVHKMNRFHWHLTDDQGWRIEIKKYPKLTEVGAWRKGSKRGYRDPEVNGDNVPHGGFYSQEEIRDVVSYAAARHVMVVPEIEMPGHSQAAIAAYPQFGCTKEKLEPWIGWGINENIYNPSEETIHFLQDVLLEVMDLFPSPFIHIGGDEAVKPQWKNSPEVQARMAELGISDVDELQSYFIKRMDTFLAQHGRRLVGWDEILEGGLAPGATVMSWRGMEHGIKAATAGHDVVMTPNSHTYFDGYQCSDIENEPMAGGGCLRLEDVYGYDPVPSEIPADKACHILGVQGQQWSETMPTTEQVEYMIFPRLCALSEVAWLQPEAKNFTDFRQRLLTHLKRLNILGVRYRPLSD